MNKIKRGAAEFFLFGEFSNKLIDEVWVWYVFYIYFIDKI